MVAVCVLLQINESLLKPLKGSMHGCVGWCYIL